MEEKYRKVKKSNAAFQRRLGDLAGADDAMRAVGFQLDGEMYVLNASADAWPRLVQSVEVVKAEIEKERRVSAGGSQPVFPPVGAGAAGMAGLPSMAGMPAGMADTVTNMMSDPSALQAMLQNPMVQQTMQNDPRFANNPMLRQSLSTLASDPQMMNRLTTMMSDPSMRQQMSQMMNNPQMAQQMANSMGGGAGGGAAGANPGGAAGGMTPDRMRQMMQAMNSGAGAPQPGNPPAPPQQNPGGGNATDQDMTEEEMIAEAIARSLRES